MATLDFSKEFIIYTNATKEVISTILLQKNKEDIEQPIAFMSQSIFDMVMKYSFIEKHAYSLVIAIERFRHLILGSHMEVRTPLPTVKFMLS